MEDKVKKQIEKLNKDQYYIVGVSGGCDSMCLLDLLNKAHIKIAICHVNYKLRHDTDIHYKVVYDYAQKYNLPFHYLEVEKTDNDNFQQFARNARYDFYHEIGALYNTNAVLLGHHYDDVLETIIMQKMRKSEYVYWGIKTQSQVRNNNVYRILLECSKQEIIDYCISNNVEYYDDYTNFETHFQRDYVRNVIIPKMDLMQRQEVLDEAIIHNINLEKTRVTALKLIQSNEENGKLKFKQIPNEMLMDVVRIYLERYVPLKRISKKLILEIMRMLKNNSSNSEISLPVNLMFIKEYDNVYIKINENFNGYNYTFDKLERFECEYFSVSICGNINEGIYLVNEDFPITIRTHLPGDKVATKYGHKKVNRLFIDAKIAPILRKSWPIVVNKDGEIVLIPDIIKNFKYLDLKPNVFVVK